MAPASHKPVEGEEWLTAELIPVKPVYTEKDLEGMEHLEYVSGLPPFLRGPYSAMYPMRPGPSVSMPDSPQLPSPTLSIAVTSPRDRKVFQWPSTSPTHRGYDADHERVVGDVGKAGVSICSLEDMKVLFDGIPLNKMSVSMTMNGAVLPVLAFYINAGLRAGRKPRGDGRYHPERHPQGVHGPQHLHLPAGILDEDHCRYL